MRPLMVLVKEADELLRTAGLLQLSNRFGFNLTDAFSRHLEDVAYFFERIAVAIAESVSKLDDLAFTVTQRFED